MGAGFGRTPRLEPRRSLILIDGENLVYRYQEMLPTRRLNPSVVHVPDLLVWHQHMATFADVPGLVRVSYYMSVVGDTAAVDAANDRVSEIAFEGAVLHPIRVCPHIFKKDSRSRKTKIVDTSITIDALRHTYQNHIDQLYLYTGDADYVPLVKEVMRQGKRVIVGALSSGLSPELKRAADQFFNLDEWFFLPSS